MIVTGEKNIDVLGVYEWQNGGQAYVRLDGAYMIEEVFPDYDLDPNDADYIIRSTSSILTLYVNTENWEGEYSSVGDSNAPNVKIFSSTLFVRGLTNKADVGGTNTFVLNEGFANFGSYKRVLPIITNSFIHSIESQATGTKYGKVNEEAIASIGEYFVKPDSPNTIMAINRSSWNVYSIWLEYDDSLNTVLEEGGERIIIKDCYELGDCISVLLKEIAPGVSHEKEEEWSLSMYGEDVGILPSGLRYLIIPKSNLLKGSYDKPSQRAEISIKDIFQLLKYALRHYMHIDQENRLRLEHIGFYENGGSYDEELIGDDLTELKEPKHALGWDYAMNSYSYDKASIPSRITTSWMDEVSEIFKGDKVEVISNIAKDGAIEERNISKFTSDIDYMLANSQEISSDGFVFIMAQYENGYLRAPFIEIDGVLVQNGYASMKYLQPQLHLYGAPAEKVRIGGEEQTVNSVKRLKVQKIEFPNFNIDPLKLIKTGLGLGKVDKLERNIHSGFIKGTIKHRI